MKMLKTNFCYHNVVWKRDDLGNIWIKFPIGPYALWTGKDEFGFSDLYQFKKINLTRGI